MRHRKPGTIIEYLGKQTTIKKVVSYLAIAVVFCTTYALILPAITMEHATYCGFEEHQHSAECYEEVLVCDREEAEGHKHTDECFKVIETLVCTEEHEHADECYDVEKELVCGKEEEKGHEHTYGCYKKVLACDKKEHEHTLMCHSDKSADVETKADWEKTMEDVEFEGDWDKDLLAIAESQLGYVESIDNFILNDKGEKRGYSRYGDWYGDTYGDWCAMFVSFCLHYADIPKDKFPHDANCEKWIKTLKSDDYELYHKASKYEPKPGDIIFFDWNSDDVSDHVGIVEKVKEDSDDNIIKVKTIEGNASNIVKRKTYDIEDEEIMGYGELPEEPEKEVKENKASEKKVDEEKSEDKDTDLDESKENVYTYEVKDIKVIATYMGEETLPEGAELAVKPYSEDDKTYAARLEEAQKVIKERENEKFEISDFRLYDIHFENDGDEIEPDGTVNVQMVLTGDKSEEGFNSEVIHFAEKETELMDIEVTEEKDETTLDFDTESFSDYGIALLGATANISDDIRRVDFFNDVFSGDDVIIYAKSDVNNVYYALGRDGERIPINVNNGVITWNGDQNIWWKYIKNGNTEYFRNGNRYLYPAQSQAVTYTSSSISVRRNGNGFAIYQPGNSTWHLIFKESYTPNWTGGANTNTEVQFAKETESTVWFDATCGGSSNYQGLMNQKAEIQTDEDGKQYVVTPTADQIGTNTNSYNYTVAGWYDLYGHQYYKPGEKVYVTDSTVFYADLVASTYDVGIPNGNVANFDTGYFVKTDVFDYNDLFNLYSANLGDNASVHNSGHDENWTYAAMNTQAVASDKSMDFVMIDSPQEGLRDLDHGPDNTNHQEWNGALYRGYSQTGIVNARPDLIPRLFTVASSDEDMILGQHYIGSDNYLYQYDENTGFYYYDSFKNSAAYNQTDQRFYVYDHRIRTSNTPETQENVHDFKLNDFLPFNYAAPGAAPLNVADGTVNYWFGMKTEINFYLPDDTGTANGNKVVDPHGNLQDMVFKFAGDDDVWIMIDDQPVPTLDLGGVHDAVYGEIDFSNGVIRKGEGNQYDNQNASGGLGLYNGTAAGTVNLKAGEHKLTIYYLERGGSRSNARIYFNLFPRYSMEINKQDQEPDSHKRLAGAEFSVYLDEACTIPAQLWETRDQYNKSSTAKNTFVADENGNISCWGLNPKSKYYIKETKPPTGYIPVTSELIGVDIDQYGNASYFKVGDNDQDWDFVSDYDVDSLSHNISFTVQNEKADSFTDIEVDKKWFDIDGTTEITDGASDEVEFKLYQVASKEKKKQESEKCKVNWIVKNPWNESQNYAEFEEEFTKGTVIQPVLDYSSVGGGSGLIVNPTVTVNGVYAGCTNDSPKIVLNAQYTLNSDMTIVLSRCSREGVWVLQNPAAKAASLVVREAPKIPDEPEISTTELGTFTISKDNDWKWKSEELPSYIKDKDGNKTTYEYYVEEVPIQYYRTEYDNNDGISEGTITIKNIQTERPSYELPMTGGSGALPYTLGGILVIGLSVILLNRRRIFR